MDAAESTSRTNGTNQEEEERKQKSSTVVRAATIIAAVGVTAWALSDNTYTEEEEERKQKSSTVVGEAVTIAAVGVVAWGISRMVFFLVKISRMLFKSAMKMKVIAEPSDGKSQTSNVTWSPPPLGRLKMNTDGGHRPRDDYVESEIDSAKLHPSGYGGILRDHKGNWVRAFIGYVGLTDNQTAELHGIHKGLELLVKLGHKGAILQTDSKGAYEWVTRRDDDWGKKKSILDSKNMIKECRDLADNNNITIEHIDRGANKCADRLANFAIKKKQEKYEELMVLPDEIDRLVSDERPRSTYEF